jgi:hypothetical protein
MADYSGTLQYLPNGNHLRSYLAQSDGLGSVRKILIVKVFDPSASPDQQADAATRQLRKVCNLPPNTAVTIHGTYINIGNTPAIAMNSSTPCNSIF